MTADSGVGPGAGGSAAEQRLLEAMEANVCVHVSRLARHTPSMTVSDGPGCLVVDSGLSADTFNVITRVRFASGTAREEAEAAVRPFVRGGRPAAWWLGPGTTPPDLDRVLAGLGWVPEEDELTGMALRLDGPPRPSPEASPLRIGPVRDPEGLAGYAGVVARSWEPPDETVPAFYRAAAGAALDPGNPSRYFVGRVDGRPAAAGELCLAAGVAGIYAVTTAPFARGRGFGTAMTARLLAEAASAGADTACLQASAAGVSLYRRLGFRPAGRFRAFVQQGPSLVTPA